MIKVQVFTSHISASPAPKDLVQPVKAKPPSGVWMMAVATSILVPSYLWFH